MHRVLWIDDSASDMEELAGPVIASGQYILIAATTPPAALARLRSETFSVVVVDIRLPPGQSPEWMSLYRERGSSNKMAKLGLELLRSLLGAESASIKLAARPEWLTANRCAVMTVESADELRSSLDALGVEASAEKSGQLPETALLELVDMVIAALGDDDGA